MHRDDPAALAAYNLEDAVLALEIAEKTDLIGFVVERARLTGLPMDRAGGAVAAFDHLYLPRLHRRGFVAPDVGVEVEAVQSPGGHVLEPVPGLWSNVLAFDFKSLYPSLILTFGIDPLGLARPGATRGLPKPRPGAVRLDLILPPECRERLDELPAAVIARRSSFDPHYRDEKRRIVEPPLWITFHITSVVDLPAWVWDAWRRAVAPELGRGRFNGSPYRAKATNRHHPALVHWALAAERGEPHAW